MQNDWARTVIGGLIVLVLGYFAYWSFDSFFGRVPAKIEGVRVHETASNSELTYNSILEVRTGEIYFLRNGDHISFSWNHGLNVNWSNAERETQRDLRFNYPARLIVYCNATYVFHLMSEVGPNAKYLPIMVQRVETENGECN